MEKFNFSERIIIHCWDFGEKLGMKYIDRPLVPAGIFGVVESGSTTIWPVMGVAACGGGGGGN